MSPFESVGKLIEQNLEAFRKPGILAVRPGYRTEAGWPVGGPVIVALVGPQTGDAAAYGLPTQIGGIPVELRQASSLERLKATRPVTYGALRERARTEQHAPDFPHEHLLAAPVEVPAAARPSPKEKIDYEPAKPALAPVTDTFTMICHASPDIGWPTLRDFFGRIEQKLVVGIYDFTSAHILEGLDAALTAGGAPHTLSLVLDHPTRNPTADQTDEQTEQNLQSTLAGQLAFAWAPVRSSPEVREWMFPTAYHIKVAVRDGAEFWLSSGNWNNSNQPENAPLEDTDQARASDTFKKSDRDWHAVVSHAGLAGLFEAFLLNDRETALPAQGPVGGMAELEALSEQGADLADLHPAAAPRSPQKYFAPLLVTEKMTVQPLLTPDKAPRSKNGIYASKMLDLVSGAQKSLYIQLQYIHPSDNVDFAAFAKLLDAVSARAAAGVDVRIILSQWQNAQWMERLQGAGVDTSLVRIQNGVHNKGFVVDHQRVVISSQNWSGEGVLQNRDAGLIIDNATVAGYFETIFLHDWDNLAVGRGNRRGALGIVGADQVYAWQDDPGDVDPPSPPPELHSVPDLSISPLKQAIPGQPAPPAGAYTPGTAEFRYWSAADAAGRGAAFWRSLLPRGTDWEVGPVLTLLLDEGEDFNAYYDRQALNFFHGVAGGRTVYSGESPDIVCHEQGHAILDALRPQLFDAGTIEASAFHESFADISALLIALQLPSMREAVLAETSGNLARNSRLSRLARQLGWAIRQIQPSAVDPDCLRNAANSFFYTNPESLPPSAPATSLSSEPHSFSRVFTGAFLEALAGCLRVAAANPSADDLEHVSTDIARLLIAGVRTAPVVPEYMSQVAGAIVAADGSAGGHYADVIKSAFVRRGILSSQSAVGVAVAHIAGIAAMAPSSVSPAARDLPHVALSAGEYGLGERPLLIRAPSEPRRFAAAAASFDVGSVTPSNSEHAARAHFEDLLQKGHVDISATGHQGLSATHPHTLKTHRLSPKPEGLVLERILFDCGFRTMSCG